MKKLKHILALDTRSLAVFRIGLALAVLFEVLFRWPYLEIFYTDHGFVPRSLLSYLAWIQSTLSLNTLSGELWLQQLLCAALLVSSACLLVGWNTRLSTLVSWVLFFSLSNRNPLVSQAGYNLTTLLLFWGLFLPLGHSWSADSKWKTRAASVTSIAHLGFFLQVAYVYWFAFIHKWGDIWWTHGSGLYFSCNHEIVAKAPCDLLLGHEWLMIQGSRLSQLVRLLGPFLLFWPGRFRTQLRALACAIFFGMHLSFEIFFSLGSFPWISMMVWTAFLPGEFWSLWKRPAPAMMPTGLSWPKASAGIALVALAIATSINFFDIMTDRSPTVWSIYRGLHHTQLKQGWAMFAHPEVGESNWLVAVGTRKDGTQVDLLAPDERVSWDLPEQLYRRFPTEIWRRYNAINPRWHHNARVHSRVTATLCRLHKGEIKSIDLYLLSAKTPVPLQKHEAKEVIRHHLQFRDCDLPDPETPTPKKKRAKATREA